MVKKLIVKPLKLWRVLLKSCKVKFLKWNRNLCHTSRLFTLNCPIFNIFNLNFEFNHPMEIKLFFKDTFEYNWQCNQKLIQLFEDIERTIPEKSIQLLNHLINAQEIWNNRILNQKSTVEVWEKRFLIDLEEINKSNYNQSLQIIETIDLSQKISYKNSKGSEFSNSVQEILFHVINHSTYHRAQIASDLKANGIEAINTDYIFYKRD